MNTSPSPVSEPPYNGLEMDIETCDWQKACMIFTKKLRILQLRARFGARELVELPDYVGSTLRGAFSAALKSSSCKGNETRACQDSCGWPGLCAYGALMETPVPENAPGRLEGSRFAPHPVVLTAPGVGGVLFPGDTFELDVTLIGKGAARVKETITALVRMASLGIGKGRGELVLRAVTDVSSGKSIWSEDQPDELDLAALSPTNLSLPSSEPSSARTPSRLHLTLSTPLQLSRGGNMVERLDAGELAYACADRFRLLDGMHGSGDFSLDAGGIAKQIRGLDIEVTHHDLRRLDIDRYSSRQRRKHALSGLIGDIVFEGEVSQLASLLQIATTVHIGKKTSFGFGHITTHADHSSDTNGAQG